MASDKGSDCCAKVTASAIVPCWNVAPWLGRCLDSVFAALPPGGEVVAVDDGSTDSTLAILRERAKTDPALRVLSVPHGGVSSARNAALDAVRGEFVFFVDPDDEVSPGFFSSAIAAMERDGAECCVCAFKRESGGRTRDVPLVREWRFGSGEEIRRDFLPRIFGYSFGDVRRWYAGGRLFEGRELAYACRFSYRASLIARAAARFDESLALNEDMVFEARCLLAARSMTSVPECAYTVHSRDSGATAAVPRDGARYCANKLALLSARNSLDDMAGGRLAPLYEGSCVFSALEIASYAARRRLPFRDGLAILGGYLSDGRVRRALRGFPLSPRRPFLALAVTALRALSPILRRFARPRRGRIW